MTQLETLRNILSDEDRARLEKIYEPTVTGVQPEDSRRSLVVMPDGEIRSYGVADKRSVFADGRRVYISSRNCGLDWKFHYAVSDTVLGAASYLPWSGKWVTVDFSRKEGSRGTFALISEIGPDDTAPRRVDISDEIFIDMFQPTIFEDERRIICCGHTHRDGWDIPTVMYSDDDGENWTLVPLRSAPKHEAVFPHLGVRWQNTGTEATFTRLDGKRLMMLVRTSLDYLYVYYSDDLGQTWTDGEPSGFHCTLTTPYLLRLSDGRTVLFWNNTRPLAERNHENEWPPVSAGCKAGNGEDVFTNRDACHVAISDDCLEWTGFRELGLNMIRNAPDFRVNGGNLSSADKSVHQFQAIELPGGKILVEYGQHEASRRIVIFDVNWLYEKSRTEDWQNGMKNVSTHLFVKSISDCHLDTGFGGHCAWNRTEGALLVPDPDVTFGEALQICRVKDERLVSDRQGMVWNFPKELRGEILLDMRVEGSGVKIRLCDHWMNPSDEYAGLYAAYDFELDSRTLGRGRWLKVRITFDCLTGDGEVSCDGVRLFGIKKKLDTPDGISYLHVQTMAEDTDYAGTLIRRMEYRS